MSNLQKFDISKISKHQTKSLFGGLDCTATELTRLVASPGHHAMDQEHYTVTDSCEGPASPTFG